MRRPGLLLSLLTALACSPGPGHGAQRDLAPLSAADSAAGPVVACMDAVLANSPLIERVKTSPRRDLPRSRYAELRNPPGPLSKGLGFAVNPASGTPRELVVGYAWPGPWQGRNGMQPPPDRQVSDIEGETMTDIATALLREVRAQCAPTTPGEPACSRVDQGRSGRCVIGL